MTRWIVDGMNVIGSRPDGWWRDRVGAQRRLLARLDAFAAATGDEVLVVFDGRPFDPDDTGEADQAEVAWASRGGRDAADDDIVRLVAEDARPESLTVVTSDATLADRVRRERARVEGAGAFLRRLDAAVAAERPASG